MDRKWVDRPYQPEVELEAGKAYEFTAHVGGAAGVRVLDARTGVIYCVLEGGLGGGRMRAAFVSTGGHVRIQVKEASVVLVRDLTFEERPAHEYVE